MTIWGRSAELDPVAWKPGLHVLVGAEELLNLQMKVSDTCSKPRRGQNDIWSFCLSQQM